MGAKSVEARKRSKADRPTARARNVLNEKLLTMTFQNARQVVEALTMIGLSKPWSRIAAAMPNDTTPTEVQRKLNSISHRRNKIVHEGDLRRQALSRGQPGRQYATRTSLMISTGFAGSSTQWMPSNRSHRRFNRTGGRRTVAAPRAETRTRPGGAATT
jgi:hypothetical protein